MRLIREESGILTTCPKCDHRFSIYENSTNRTIRTSRDIYDAFMHLATVDQEELHIAILNSKNMIMSQHMVYKGNVSATLVRISEVLREVIKANAPSFIVVHNHPSGNPTPSPDDLHLTAEILAASKLFDIDCLDHVIIAGTEYVSLRDRGINFDRTIKSNPYQGKEN